MKKNFSSKESQGNGLVKTHIHDIVVLLTSMLPTEPSGNTRYKSSYYNSSHKR